METLLSQRREARAQAALRLAAEALASDADACAEAREMAADYLIAENEALAGAEAPATTTTTMTSTSTSTSTEPWWR